MNVPYLYSIFECAKQHNCGLNIALARLQTTLAIPEGLTEKIVTEFMGRHYNELVDAYAVNFAVFAECVAKCEQSDKELAEK